jgi:formylglycine-generating enzyme required for sulfatase activity
MGSNADEIARLLGDWPHSDAEERFVLFDWSFKDEMPQHKVYLDTFYIDKYEVTNARFQQFIQATGYLMRMRSDGSTYVWHAPQGQEQHPVVDVNHEDAKAYCVWAGKRLPTEAEWEKAARGTDGRIYPWGNQFDGKRGNFCDRDLTCPQKGGAKVVGSYEEGKSPYGAYDMSGNVWEWVADRYHKDYYKNSPMRNPQGPASSAQAVLRGGGWSDSSLYVRASTRYGRTPTYQNDALGFRCAKTP